MDIEDLYDEFSFGQKTPFAIKAFLTRAQTWGRAPRYVLFVGGATYDPRNYTNLGNLDFVPTKLLDTAIIETASDDWFVDFDGNGLPELPIGRLPVNTVQEASAAVAKLIAYEQSAPSTKALYVADIPDQVGDFEAAIKPMESLISLVPEELFRADLGDDTGAALLTRLNEGAGLVTYLGHGSMQVWNGSVLDTTSADTLTNTTFPFFVALTCLNGYFLTPTIDSLASVLVTDAAGAKPIGNPYVMLREEFDDWAILYDPDTGHGFGLNPTGVYIWKCLDGEHSIDDLYTALSLNIQDLPQEVREHLISFIEGLAIHGLAL